MLGIFPVEVFKERAKKMVACALQKGKPVVAISHFGHFRDLDTSENAKENLAYIAALQEICQELQCENLYYIDSRELVEDFTWLAAALIHPSISDMP